MYVYIDCVYIYIYINVREVGGNVPVVVITSR